MPSRVRHCVECPKCLTRYLVGFSPYTNGSYLRPLSQGLWEEWILYCTCRLPHASSRWNWKELKLCEVSYQAHQSGYGAPDEIVVISQASSLLAKCLCRQVELFTAENAEPPGEFAKKFKITPVARLRQAGNPCPCEDRVWKEIPHGAHADLDAAQNIQSISLSRFPKHCHLGIPKRLVQSN